MATKIHSVKDLALTEWILFWSKFFTESDFYKIP